MTDRKKASTPVPNPVKTEPSTSQEQSEQRPKRSIIRKNLPDEIYGLCWQEENELQKALLASLHDRRRVSAELDSSDSNVYRQYAGFVRVSQSMPPSGSSSSTGTFTRRNPAASRSGCSSAATSRSTSVDEGIKEGIKVEPPEIFSPPLKHAPVKQENKSTKVHAQRKFASNSSLPSTPSASPSKFRLPLQAPTTVPAVFPKTAKTEDFLTFLCLRGSSLLPPHLDFGYPRQDSPLSPRQSTASRSGTTRESTPDVSSSSESDEFTNIRTLKSVHTPLRKAARACASTPETARGLASVQPRSPSKTAKRSPHKGVLKSRKSLLVSPIRKQIDRSRTNLHTRLSKRSSHRGISPEDSSQSVCSSVSQHCPPFEHCNRVKLRKQCRKQKPVCACTLTCTTTLDSCTNLNACSSNPALMSQSTKPGCVDPTAALYSALHGSCSSRSGNLSSNFSAVDADGPAAGNLTPLVRCSLSSDLTVPVNYRSQMLSPAYSDSYKVLSVSSADHTMCANSKSLLSSSSLSHISSHRSLDSNVNTHHLDPCSKPSQTTVVQANNGQTLPSLLAKYPETFSDNNEITYFTKHEPKQGQHSMQSWINSELLPIAVTGQIARSDQDSESSLTFTSDRLEDACHIAHQQQTSHESVLLNNDVLWPSDTELRSNSLTLDDHFTKGERIDESKSFATNMICTEAGEGYTLPQMQCVNSGLDLHTELFNGEFRGLDNAEYIAADAEEMLSEHAYTQVPGQTDNNLYSRTIQRLPSHYAVEKPYAMQHILSGNGECPHSKTELECWHPFPELHTPLMSNQCAESSAHDNFGERRAAVPPNMLDTNSLKREYSRTHSLPAYTSLLSKGMRASGVPRECFQTTNLPGFRGWPNTGGYASLHGVSVGCNNRLLPAYKCALQHGLSLSPLPPTLVSVIPIVCNSSRRSSLAYRPRKGNTSVSHTNTQANFKMIRKLRCAKKKLMELKSQIKMEDYDDEDDDDEDDDDDDDDDDDESVSPAAHGKDEIMVCLERGSTKRKVSMKNTGHTGKKVFKQTMQTNRKAHRRKDSDPDYCEENKRCRTKSKPTRKKTLTIPLNNRSDHRRRNVASSLARLTASRRLAQLRQRQGTTTVSLLKRKVLNQPEPLHVTRRLSGLSDADHSYASDIKNKTLLEIGLPPLRRKSKGQSGVNTPVSGDAQSPATSQSPQLTQSSESADDNLGVMVNIPVFYPTEAEFLDPLQYISAIRSRAESFGMCKIIPPASWKPEVKVQDDLRFTSQLQYIHKLFKRWGISVNDTETIRKHLASLYVTLDPPPQVGGIEVDLPRLYHTIHRFGGMKSVAEKKTWIKVADTLGIPKLAQDRATRLYDVYCKYLLSYSLLSETERVKLKQNVAMERQRVIRTHGEQLDGTVKGRSMSVSDFVRLSRNMLSMYYDQEPSVIDVERDYWPFVNDRGRHVVVQCAHVDTRNQTGINVINKKDLNYSKHGWNFQNLADHPQTILRTLGQLTGMTAPTLHLGMLFTTSCWSTDLHRLPYVHCLHSGADIVWYSIPGNEEKAFHEAVKSLTPALVNKTGHWLREDTLMISPEELQKKGVSLGRCVQSVHEFVVVFSNCFTATVSCGYNLAESVHYAFPDWLSLGVQLSQMLYESHEPVLFSIESLLYSLAQSAETSDDVIARVLPHLQSAIDEELALRKKLQTAGLRATRHWGDSDESMGHASKKRRSMEPVHSTCEVSKKICFFSMVVNETDGTVYSLQHALTHIQRKQNLSACRFVYQFTEEELKSLLRSTKERLNKTKRLSVEEPESLLPRTRGARKP